MLNKRNRISNRNVIEKLSSKGKLYKNQFFVYKYERKSEEPSQFAVSISKKIHKKATKRNRLRRQIHEALRANLPLLKKDFIVLVIVRSATADQKATFQELNQSINTFFNTLQSNAE